MAVIFRSPNFRHPSDFQLGCLSACLVLSSSFIFDKESWAQVASVRVPTETQRTGSVPLTWKCSQFHAVNTASQTPTLLMCLRFAFVPPLLLLLLNYYFSFFRPFSVPIKLYSCSTLSSSFNYTTSTFISSYRSFSSLCITFRFAQYSVLYQYFYFCLYRCYSSTTTATTVITAITSSSSSPSLLTLPP